MRDEDNEATANNDHSGETSTTSTEFSFHVSLSEQQPTCPHINVPADVIHEFQRDGFVSFPHVLNMDDVDRLNDRLEKVLRGDYDRAQKPDKTPRLLKSQYQSGQFSSTSTSTASVEQTENNTKYDNDENNSTKPNNIASKPNNKTKTTATAKGPLGFSGNLQNVKVLQVINIQKCDALFRILATSRALGKVVSQLAGWAEGARLAQDQVWAKPPGASPLVFHRDSPYFMVR